jgi:choline dehydrogenase-like flavoprotein
MIVAAETNTGATGVLTADVVIVGAGTVGLFLAKCLAARGRSVLIIEGGSRVAATTYDGQGAKSVGRPHFGVLTGRAMGLGGTSVLWGGQLAEFVECDVTRPGHEWPLRFDELRQWYDYTYEQLGLAKQATIADYQREFGIEVGAHHAIEQFFTSWLPQPNFAVMFRNEVIESKTIQIVLNATVSDISMEGGRANAITAIRPTGQRLTIKGNDFVFAAGTIANSQFFLSTQKRSNVPWKTNQSVGRYFHDHLAGKAADVEILNEKRFRTFFENGYAVGRKLQPKLRFTQPSRAETATGICGMFAFHSSGGAHLTNIKTLVKGMKSGLSYSAIRTLPRDVVRLGGSFAPFVIRYIKDRRLMAMFDQGVEFTIQAEQWPIADSRIRIIEGAAAGPTGLLPVGLDWQLDGRELATIRRFVQDTDTYLQENGLARLRYHPKLFDDRADYLKGLIDTYHQCGGLRMSSHRGAGVTDANCRVWDTDNVFVAGSAVLPSSSYANSTLTGLALTARLSQFLLTAQRATVA